MIDRHHFARAVAGLHDVIESESELAEFLPASRELRGQAEAFAQGQLPIMPLSVPTRIGTIPSRDLAVRVMEAFARIPTIDGDEDPVVLRAVGQIFGNLVDGVLHAIYAAYPDVVPRQRSSD